MKISEHWLREWVQPSVRAKQLAHQLTMAGLEVDSIEPAGAALENVVVGQIVKIAAHPDADKLRVCQVDVGNGEALIIVCGATNAREGLRVPTARVGAKLAGGISIKKSKLRGVASFGMLCSAKELGLAESSDGLMELAEDAPIGTRIGEYLNLDDPIISVDLTPNRGDCLSIAGIAREVGVLNRCPVSGPTWQPIQANITDTFPVMVENPRACPRYLGRVVRNIDAGASTPMWMQERLRRCGVRALHPVVDVTNYVLLELGHPMHAFDLDKLASEIRVRNAKAGEPIQLLDGKNLTLSEEDLVIADANHALALAGIMGGNDSAVSPQTNHIFLECAYFSPVALSGRARYYGLHTESSHRFERGVNPDSLQQALERATQLLIEITGGQAGPIIDCTASQQLPQPKPIVLRAQRLQRVLGMEVPETEVADILTRLGLDVEKRQDGWQVQAPSYRFDIEIEADLIEEIGRVYGYNNLPTRKLLGQLTMHPTREQALSEEQLCHCLISRGFQEVITYSFIDPGEQALFDSEATAVALANPISSEMSVMRTRLWPGLVRTIAYNLNRQQQDLRIFEVGLIFCQDGDAIKQDKTLAGALVGNRYPEQWHGAHEKLDFYDLKAHVEALVALTQKPQAYSFEAVRLAALQPGQAAEIKLDDITIGVMGCLHPKILQKIGIKEPIFVFELNLARMGDAALPAFTPLSKFPSIRRDLAILVDESVQASQIRACIEGVLPDLLQEYRLFDVYRGKGIDLGRKSLALGLILQDSSRTLTDNDIDVAIERVVTKLKEQFGATLRD